LLAKIVSIAMQVSLIVNIIGPDRPGLVEQLSTAINASAGNWESSRMMQLAGQFAGMVQVVILERDVADFEEKLAGLEGAGLKVSIVNAGEIEAETKGSGKTFVLEVVGQDRPGIVAAISKALAEAGANVVELATDCSEAPMSGERLFRTHAAVVAPENTTPEELRDRIESIAIDLMVEIQAEGA